MHQWCRNRGRADPNVFHLLASLCMSRATVTFYGDYHLTPLKDFIPTKNLNIPAAMNIVIYLDLLEVYVGLISCPETICIHFQNWGSLPNWSTMYHCLITYRYCGWMMQYLKDHKNLHRNRLTYEYWIGIRSFALTYHNISIKFPTGHWIYFRRYHDHSLSDLWSLDFL